MAHLSDLQVFALVGDLVLHGSAEESSAGPVIVEPILDKKILSCLNSLLKAKTLLHE